MPTTVPELLVEWDRRRRDGTPVSLEDLCAGRTELLVELCARAHRLQECDRLLGLTAPTPDPPDPVPGRIGGYEIQGVLGRGGMGVVYRGWDPGLKRPAAVKVLRPTAAYRPFVRPTELRARFDREREVLGRLEHAHLVPVYGSGVSDDQPYIAMALIAGGSARDRAAELSRRGPRAVAEFVAKAAEGVHAAHALGILHRDLKPANILLTTTGEPRVADFGLARFWSPDTVTDAAAATDAVAADEDETWVYGEPRAEPASPSPTAALTLPGVQPGTPAYMAPEQFDPSRGRVGPATDVWALGAVLFELICGHRPFSVADDRPLAKQVCTAPTPRCRSAHGRVPGWLRDVVNRCLAKDPADRYPSAQALAAAMRAGLRAGRRRAWLAGAVGVLALAAAAGLTAGRLWPTDPPSTPGNVGEPRFEDLPEVKRALTDLAERREVILIDAQHQAPYRWVWDETTGQAGRIAGEPFHVYSRWPGPTAVEFLPWLPPGRFRVRARLRHVSGDTMSTVALYADGRTWRSNAGKHLACIWLEFADWGSKADGPLLQGQTGNALAILQRVLLTDSPRRGPRPAAPVQDTFHDFGNVSYMSAKAEGRPAEFRTVELVVGNGAAEGWWGTTRLGPVPAENFQEFVAECRRRYPSTDGEGAPGAGPVGGVGLVIYNGVVSVEDFRIIPLSD